MILEMLFYLFYNYFLHFATIVEISENYLLKELKNRVLSRMQKTIFDVLFIVEILNELKTYLIQLNSRQRHYIASRASSKNEIVVVTLFKSFDINTTITIKTSVILEIFSEIFTRSREDTSVSDNSAPRSNHILKSQNLFEQTTCYNCNEIDHFVSNCSHLSKRE